MKNTRTDHFESYKSLFAKECLLQTRDHPRYKEWECQETLIQGFNLHNLNGREKLHKNKKDEVQNNEEEGNDQKFRIVKERISFSNIFEVEKSVISRKGGKLTNTVVKEVFAKVTTRQVKKRSNENVDGHKDAKRVKMSSRGLRYHATNVNNILEHVSAHDKETQAIIVAKVVDQNGKDFANEVTKNSKQIQNDLDRTDLVIISPGRSNFPPNFSRSRKLRNFGSDIFSNGKSKSN